MNILYGANENYVRYLAASLISLLENNRDFESIKIFILSFGISKESKEKLTRQVKDYDREIVFLELSDLKNRFDYNIDTGSYDISVMGRLFMGLMLPQDIKRVIYLDCDTIICSSLKKLWNYNLRGKALGAVLEPTIDKQLKVDIGTYIDAPYFNSGVLLIDLSAYRKKKFLERILAYQESINDVSLFADQDAINGALRWEIRILPPTYNFFTNYRYWSYNALVEQDRIYSLIPRKDFEKAKKNPTIIHFAGDERPWRKGNFNPYRKKYEKYNSFSAWGDYTKEECKEFYMLFYHIVNLATLISPRLRKMISRVYLRKQRKRKKT